MEIFTTIILPILTLLLGGSATWLFFYQQEKKVKAAAGTSADSENSIKLIEIQEKYIDLINEKDSHIRKLQDELLKSQTLCAKLSITHCQNIGCQNRVPPMSLDLLEMIKSNNPEDNG